MEETEETQPELSDIIEAINRYVVVNRGNVSFICSFIAFDKEKLERGEKDIFKEGTDRILAYGEKAVLLIDLEELEKRIKAEEGDFVNW